MNSVSPATWLWPALLTLQHVGLSPPEGKGVGRSGEGTTLLKPNPGAGGGNVFSLYHKKLDI